MEGHDVCLAVVEALGGMKMDVDEDGYDGSGMVVETSFDLRRWTDVTSSQRTSINDRQSEGLQPT